MKTFEDLEFEPHPDFGLDTHAEILFPNGWGISVINGEFAYCDENTYEVATIFNDEFATLDGEDDYILRYQTPEDITEIMKKLQEMKPKEV